MTVATLPELIDKQDAFEIVRAQIVEILSANMTQQGVLATAAGEDPNLFTARVFEEASNPFEDWLNSPSAPADRRPIVNVMFDNSSADMAGSDVVQRQKTTGSYNIDCYGYAVASDNADGGHNPGDRAATLAVQRCVRIVRNILMSGQNTYLQLRKGTNPDCEVWGRWIRAITMFQPAIEGRTVQQVVACRIAFDVVFNEYSPQITGEPAEIIGYTVNRAETGEVLISAEIDVTDGD